MAQHALGLRLIIGVCNNYREEYMAQPCIGTCMHMTDLGIKH